MKINLDITASLFFTSIILIVSLLYTSAYSLPVKFQWGTPIETIKNSHKPGETCTLFKPKERPDYKNKILGFILGIDANAADRILILRTGSDPRIDYLFVNNRLYTVMEDYGIVNETRIRGIQSALERLYGPHHLKQDSNLYIYSYKNDTTRVLFYVIRQSEERNQCRLYLYTSRLFSTLLLE